MAYNKLLLMNLRT